MNLDVDMIKKVTAKDTKTLEQTVLKAMEELGEVAEALLSAEKVTGCEYKNKSNDDVIEECCDVMLVILSLIFKMGDESSADIINKKLKKWEEKITE